MLILLTGCISAEEAQGSARDAQRCSSLGLVVGTERYANCKIAMENDRYERSRGYDRRWDDAPRHRKDRMHTYY